MRLVGVRGRLRRPRTPTIGEVWRGLRPRQTSPIDQLTLRKGGVWGGEASPESFFSPPCGAQPRTAGKRIIVWRACSPPSRPLRKVSYYYGASYIFDQRNVILLS